MRYFILLLVCTSSFAQTTLQKTWSTYYFGNSSNLVNSAIDNDGNIIVVGYTDIKEPLNYYTQFTTLNCYQSTPMGGLSDGFIAKFSTNGLLIWSTYFGGESVDAIRKIAVDSQNNYYVVGYTGSINNIATPNAYISNKGSMVGDIGFLAKFNTLGQILFSTFIPGYVFDVKISNNNVYISGDANNDIINLSTPNVYNQNFIPYSCSDFNYTDYGYLMKFDSSGNRLLGTYLDKKCIIGVSNIEITNNYEVIIASSIGNLNSNNYSSGNIYQPNYGGGGGDIFLMKISADFSQKIWATYYGGTMDDFLTGMTVDGTDIYITGNTKSPNNIATSNSFQPNITNTTTSDCFIAKFNDTGNRLWGTYFGGIKNDIAASVVIHNNKLYATGFTNSSGLATIDGYQNSFEQLNNAGFLLTSGLISEFNLDGNRNWTSYYNGTYLRTINFYNFNGFYITGYTASATGISTLGALQPNLNIGTTQPSSIRNIFLSKFEYVPLNITSFTSSTLQIYPNPNNGSFNLKGDYSSSQLNVEINDLNGRLLEKQTIPVFSPELNVNIETKNKLASGEYLVNLLDQNKVLQSFKIIVR